MRPPILRQSKLPKSAKGQLVCCLCGVNVLSARDRDRRVFVFAAHCFLHKDRACVGILHPARFHASLLWAGIVLGCVVANIGSLFRVVVMELQGCSYFSMFFWKACVTLRNCRKSFMLLTGLFRAAALCFIQASLNIYLSRLASCQLSHVSLFKRII